MRRITCFKGITTRIATAIAIALSVPVFASTNTTLGHSAQMPTTSMAETYADFNVLTSDFGKATAGYVLVAAGSQQALEQASVTGTQSGSAVVVAINTADQQALTAKEPGYVSAVVAVDTSKAFDTVTGSGGTVTNTGDFSQLSKTGTFIIAQEPGTMYAALSTQMRFPGLRD